MNNMEDLSMNVKIDAQYTGFILSTSLVEIDSMQPADNPLNRGRTYFSIPDADVQVTCQCTTEL